MALKTFGFLNVSNSYYAGSNVSKCVGQRMTMPERGKILAVRVKLARYDSSSIPKVWGMIWARTSGAILSQSPNYVSPTNTYTNLASLAVFEIAMDGAVIEAGTSIWVGFARSTAAGQSLRWGFQTGQTGQNTDEGNGAATVPTTFVTSVTDADETLYVEVVYQTGGEVKVIDGNYNPIVKPAKAWNGSSWVKAAVKHWNGSSWKESNS